GGGREEGRGRQGAGGRGGGGTRGLAGAAHPGRAGPPLRAAEAAPARVALGGAGGPRLPRRGLDLRPRRQGHRAGVRRALPQGPRQPAAQEPGLDAPGASPPRRAARRGGHRALARRGLARTQKKARAERRTLLFVDESGFYLLPGRVKTYSPQGLTPVLYEWQTRDHLSVMAGLTRRGRLFTLVGDEALSAAGSAGFPGRAPGRGRRAARGGVGGGPGPRGPGGAGVLAGGAGRRLHLEALPGYAPALTPVEGLWQHLKHVELRNVVCLGLDHLREELRLAVARLRHKVPLVRGFFGGAGLT